MTEGISHLILAVVILVDRLNNEDNNNRNQEEDKPRDCMSKYERSVVDKQKIYQYMTI